MERYIHEPLEEEVRAISGGYRYVKEDILPYRDRDILCLVGVGHIDNSCCGVGGCIFIRIPGYILSWKETTADGKPVSTVEPIVEEAEQRDIEKILQVTYPAAQVFFSMERY